MIAVIQPSILKGIVRAPASKSSMQRACAAALLAKGTSIIRNPGHSNDDKAALDIIKKLGAEIIINPDEVTVRSRGVHPLEQKINCGESGLSIRMFTPIVGLADQEITIDGEGSLLNRPMDFFDEILPQLRVIVQSNNGKLPLKIKGPLQPKNIEIDGSLSSQFLTGLLMAYSAAYAKDVSIKVSSLASKPYIDLTLAVMKQFGLKTPENKNYEEFIFPITTPDSRLPTPSAADRVPPSASAVAQGLPQAQPDSRLPTPDSGLPTPDSRLPTHDYTVEGDWSGGAFLLVAGAIAGSITIRGLDLTSTQADKAIVDALMAANASIAIEAKGIKIHPAEMNGFEFDATDCPDLFPPLVALAAYCNGETKIKGVNRLTHKESNRSVSLRDEFGKMGVKVEVNGDIMIIHGGKGIRGCVLHSHHDHRIAMACAVAALRARGEMTIEEADAVRKSYPDFYDDLKKLGADVSLSSKIKFHE